MGWGRLLMAFDTVVDKARLDSAMAATADAIREKTGSSDLLTWDPDTGFKEAVSGIQPVVDTSMEDALLNRTVTEIDNDRVTKLGAYGLFSCRALTSVNLPEVTELGNYSLYDCTHLITLSMPKVTIAGSYFLVGAIRLPAIDFPLLQSAGINAFSNCTVLTEVNLPELTALGASGFSGCTNLKKATLPKLATVNAATFNNCKALTAIVLGGTCVLANTSAFTGTPIASGAGYIYFPDDEFETKKSETNWSVYADQIKPLSEVPV